MADWLVITAACALGLYSCFVLALLLRGRREDARAWAGFIPDCLVLLKRLLRDDRVPRGRKLLIVALVGYLALPIDLVPDFIPVVGHLDDAIVVGFVVRVVLRSAGVGLIREHWPGPPSSLALMLRLTDRKASASV
jgi:uncharacterized membrane protein YkvA (DUF1232 family)